MKKIKRKTKGSTPRPHQLTGLTPGLRMKGGVRFDPDAGYFAIVHTWNNIECHGEPEEWRYPEAFPTEEAALQYYTTSIRPVLKQMMADMANKHPGVTHIFREDGQPSIPISPRFRFEPGAYGISGCFLPALACLEQIAPDLWEHYYLVVDPNKTYTRRSQAVSQAEADLEAAFQHRQQAGSDDAVGEYLSRKGYVRVNDPRSGRSGGAL